MFLDQKNKVKEAATSAGAGYKMHNMKHSIRRFVGRCPFLYYNLALSKTHLSANRQTELVIEGAPRSGNSFAVVAFQHAQRKNIQIAHHLHVPAQIIRAVKRNIPTMVLIRQPLDVVSSTKIRHPEMPINEIFKNYIWFYRSILNYSNSYLICSFSSLIKDYGLVIKCLNRKFGTNFAPFKHTKENVDIVFSHIDQINEMVGRGLEEQNSRPSELKEHLKIEVLKKAQSQTYASLAYQALAIYDKCLTLK